MPRRKDTVMTTTEYEEMVDTATGPVAPGQLTLDGTTSESESPESENQKKRTRTVNPRAVMLGKCRSILLDTLKDKNSVTEVREIAFDPSHATEMLVKVDDEEAVQITSAVEFILFLREAPGTIFNLPSVNES